MVENIGDRETTILRPYNTYVTIRDTDVSGTILKSTALLDSVVIDANFSKLVRCRCLHEDLLKVRSKFRCRKLEVLWPWQGRF